MPKFNFFALFLISALLNANTAFASQPICHDFTSEIEPDMQRQDSDFTQQNYKSALERLETTLPEWMEKSFKRNKDFPTLNGQLFQGDIWLAYANSMATVKGYVLKLEYLSARPEDKEAARQLYCTFLVKTPYFD